VAFRALEVWNWEAAVAWRKGEVVDCRSTTDNICGLAARRATGPSDDAMMSCCRETATKWRARGWIEVFMRTCH
jgi:hypothetical protein